MSKKPKRRRPSITNAKLLQLLLDGDIVVDLETAKVMKHGVEITPTIVGKAGRNGTRCRVEICVDGCKRTICRARLVYMAGGQCQIPAHFEVHHLNEDRYGDRWVNLIAVSTADHLKLHRNNSDEDVPF